MPAPGEHATVFDCVAVTWPGEEEHLCVELEAEWPGARASVQGPMTVHWRAPMPGFEPVLGFAAQVMPGAQWQPGIGSVSDRVHAVLQYTGEVFAAHCPWRLHHFRILPPRIISYPALDKACREALKTACRKSLRRLAQANNHDPWCPGEALVQSLMPAGGELCVSAAAPEILWKCRRIISPWPGGFAHIRDDKRPPSRAYQKVYEAWAHGCPRPKNASVADLGCSPGSWSHAALAEGCRVTGVDRQPPAPEIGKHPQFRFHKGDALAFEPEAPVDWLWCDVIARPERTLACLRRWLTRGYCRYFLVTLKFQGEPAWEIILETKRLCRSLGAEFTLRRLYHNKNEMMIWGSVPSSPDSHDAKFAAAKVGLQRLDG